MRLILAIALLSPLPAQAWEASIGATCRLSHETPEATVRLTYDPSLPEYTITIARTGAIWPDAPVFSLHFFGEAANQIATDRHVLSEDGRAVTVTDRGFGNVLDGLQYNQTASAFLGDQALSIGLEGAAPAVAAFRACAEMPTA